MGEVVYPYARISPWKLSRSPRWVGGSERSVDGQRRTTRSAPLAGRPPADLSGRPFHFSDRFHGGPSPRGGVRQTPLRDTGGVPSLLVSMTVEFLDYLMAPGGVPDGPVGLEGQVALREGTVSDPAAKKYPRARVGSSCMRSETRAVTAVIAPATARRDGFSIKRRGRTGGP